MNQVVGVHIGDELARVESGLHRQRRFETLEGLRGIAAIAVAIMHSGFFFGGWHLRYSYLAVDLFFVLSGFVIPFVYQRKLEAGMSTAEFMTVRAIRLYPMFILATLLGAIVAFVSIKMQGAAYGWTYKDLGIAVLFSSVMSPTPALSMKAWLYPLDGATWSVFFELVANLIYVLAWRQLSNLRVLAAVLVVSGLALIAAALKFGTLDIGFGWHDAIGGLARVCFSFSAGLLLYQFHKRDWLPRINAPLLCGVLVLALFAVPYSGPGQIVYQMVCVLLLFPALIMVALSSTPTGPLSRAFVFLGQVSYGLYVLQMPTYHLIYGALGVLHVPIALWMGPVFIVGLVVAAWILGIVYDEPFRRILAGVVRRAELRAATNPA